VQKYNTHLSKSIVVVCATETDICPDESHGTGQFTSLGPAVPQQIGAPFLDSVHAQSMEILLRLVREVGRACF